MHKFSCVKEIRTLNAHVFVQFVKKMTDLSRSFKNQNKKCNEEWDLGGWP